MGGCVKPPIDYSTDDDYVIPQYDGNLTDISLDSSLSSISESDINMSNKSDISFIPVIVTQRLPKESQADRVSANVNIKRQCKKVVTATQLPVVVNLNPRSIYNKKEEFRTMMDQMDVDLCCISESWDRDNRGLEHIIQMEGYQIVKNVLQRSGKGGKPALVIKKDKYFIKELCPTVLTVPPTVEATWALLTPKAANNPAVKYIAVASIYYAKRTKRKDFIDHICEAYNVLLAKYGQGLHFIIAGDFNRLNINPILDLSPSLRQVVSIPTRLNPDATLDKIVTTLSKFYHPPTSLPPLDNDIEGNGKPSDHLIIVMRPISQSNYPKVKKKMITFRPLPESGMLMFKQWLFGEAWQQLYQMETAHEKAEYLQQTLLDKLDVYLPQKTINIRADDEPWVTSELKQIDRNRKREYCRKKKSPKWKKLEEDFVKKSEKAKTDYSQNIVNDLKSSNQSQWYSKIKRMTSHSIEEETAVVEFQGLSDQVQTERIADQFEQISNLYSPLKKDDIDVSNLVDDRPPPEINPYIVYLKIISHKKRTATVIDDIPMKVIRYCAEELSFPLSDIYERAILHGEYPNIYKQEIVTPAPKVYPPQTAKDLRKISGTINFSRIFEKILADVLVLDMKPTRDPSQYGNSKGVGTQHYLIKMIDRILTVLDTNNQKEANAVIVQLVDWAQAFDRQCPLLGIKSFIQNGVRKSVIPVLTSFFQDRKMKVKWHNQLSTQRDLPGGGPQGSSIGLLEYDAQSNDNTDFLSSDDKYKFVDDLSILELINLITMGLSSYNFRQHVASDIGINQLYLPSENIQSQSFMNNISEWTANNRMQLNESKTKVMVFNYTRNYQFSTRIMLNGSLLDTVNETLLLGTVITSDLKWHKNTEHITRKGYQRMTMLRKLVQFNIPQEDMLIIYCQYIRSMLEYNSSVWFSNITEEEKEDIERVQRCAVKLILNSDYSTYENALTQLNLQNLSDRREMLALRFAKKCTRHERFADMFPLNDDLGMELRNGEQYYVKFASTGRLKDSAIPTMQKLLNEK